MPQNKKITLKDRVITSLGHNEPDVMPYSISMTKGAHDKMAEFYNDPDFMKGLDRYLVSAGVASRLPDKWFTEQTFDDCEIFMQDSNERYDWLAKFAEENKDSFIIIAGTSYFETAWGLYGMQNLMADMAGNEKFVYKIMDRIHEHYLNMIGQIVKFDIDCVHINDDYGMQTGLIMGPVCWRKFFKPYLKEAVAKIKSGGKYAQLHSCGDLREIMPDLVEIGFDILNPFQPEAMDVYEIKKEFGKYITFSGGVSEQKVMAQGTPDDVERETKEKMKLLGKNGGYIVGPSQAITDDVPAESIDRFIKIVTNQ
ncbi:MAG: hypothetical protein FWE82_03695 [Defluviitaleaceae bacterium]|nr:hypothetical protein [Defluviitaleaceae bacterium]